MAVSSPDDEPARDQHANKLPQYAFVLLATLANFSTGTCFAWISPAIFMYGIYDTTIISGQDISWLCSLVSLGAALSCFPAGIMADKIGRKTSIKIVSLLLLACWLIIGLVYSKVWIYLARITIGIVCGAYSIIIPIYLTEIVDKELKESLSMICQLQFYLGILYAYFTGFSYDLLTMALLCAVPTTVLSVASFVMPESPVWLTTQNRQEEADEVMRSLKRNQTEDTDRTNQQTGYLSVFKAHTKATIIAFTLVSIQQMSGMPIFIIYASVILDRLGFPMNPMISSVIMGFVLVMATYCYPPVLKTMNMKLLLFLSLTVMSICLFTLSGYFRLANSFDVSVYSCVPFLCIIFFMIAFVIGCEPVSWILIDKIFTSDVKRVAITGSVICNWISSFMTTKSFQDVVVLMGFSTVFAIYGVSTLMGTAFIARMIPETEGKTEEEVQMDLRGRNPEGSEIPTCC
ncbi:facilitated trehalose transporter Tret1-like isoform X1 [Megachile rotundata]|uniref:facilitated trehalose transporter Tret1-like isoform X1 n=2 Tax=Megachile rotundata TaxID=143995 RepID=UPI003FD0E6EA